MSTSVTVEIQGEVRSCRTVIAKSSGDPFLAVMVLPEDGDSVVELFGPADKWEDAPERGDLIAVNAKISIREQEGYKPQLSVWCEEILLHKKPVEAGAKK